MGVSPSSFYDYKKGPQKSEHSQKLERRVIGIFREHKRRYGTRRIVSQLSDEGIKVGRQRVGSILKKYGLQAIQPRSFVPRTTQSDKRFHRFPNLLLGKGKVEEPNKRWVGDITYLPMIDGRWNYLSTWLDMWSHVIVGFEVMDNMEEVLVINSLKKAILRRSFEQGLIVHTDGGGQYVSSRFKRLCRQHKMIQSMTRRDNHYDNAMAESLFSRIKAEMLDGGIKFKDTEQAKRGCFEYIEMYYNTKRKHSTIGNKNPLQFEREMGY